MRTKFCIGSLCTIAIIILLIFACGTKPTIFVDIPTFVLIIFAPAAIAFASWPVKAMGRAFSAPFDSAASKAELGRSVLFFASCRRWILIAAAAGAMMGLVAILAGFSVNGDNKRLGPNLAVMLLSVADSLFLDLVVTLPLESLAKRRLAELDQ